MTSNAQHIIKKSMIGQLVLGLLFITGTPHLMAQSEGHDKPNVLFIILDDMNDYVGEYDSYPSAQTPNIDMLAAQSVVFTNAQSNGAWCAQSRVSMINGFHPHTTNTYRNLTIRENPVFKDVKNVFQHFKVQGY